jgi:capsid protein
MAAGMNMTYEQFSRDYSQTNYSGHRAALLDYWRFVTGRRSKIAGTFARAAYTLVLEEMMDAGEVDIPAGVPSYYDEPYAWSCCEWIGPGRGQIDPLKEANATRVEYTSGLTTLEIEAAERGRDWRKLIEQRAQESAYIRDMELQYKLEPGSLNFGGPSPVQQPPDGPDTTPAQYPKQEQQ